MSTTSLDPHFALNKLTGDLKEIWNQYERGSRTGSINSNQLSGATKL